MWQLAQVPMTCVWSVTAPIHVAVDAWQLAHSVLVAICVADLPVAAVPLWQLPQGCVNVVWSTVAPSQEAVDLWHVSQAAVVRM